MERLAILTTKFSQNILKDESTFTLPLSEAELGGLPEFVKVAARSAASDRGLEGYVVTLSRSLVVPFLTFSDHRDLRHKAWEAWTSRGELAPDRDNKAVITEILQLRAEQARMHGYASYADFATADTMAGSPEAVMGLLERVWAPAKASAERERAALEDLSRSLSTTTTTPVDPSVGVPEVAPWDWRYLAEKVRQTRYDLNESEVKPYFSLERMCEAVFDCAGQLFGLRFLPRSDLTAYHPDVKVYEVFESAVGGGPPTPDTDTFVGLFLHDNFSRAHKESGAWMSAFRGQSRNGSAATAGQPVHPIIINNNNFARGAEGCPTLLSFDDARTLFHEFGHGLHGMLSDVPYQRLAGTSVLRDFVELPSQLFEHWLAQPAVLKKHARHVDTDEPIPDELLARLMAARCFNQGFDTVEYTASALVDQAVHKLSAEELSGLDLDAFESAELTRLGMPAGIVMRHRLPHFQHLFSSSAYSAAYYVYLWAGVLDADGFDAFLESGDCFDAETAGRVRRFVYSSGNSIEPREAYRLFRGRDPAVEPMLRKKGLL